MIFLVLFIIACNESKRNINTKKHQTFILAKDLKIKMELKNKKLELDENEQIIDMLKTGSSDNFKREKAQLDRDSKKEIKEMTIDAEDNRVRERIMKDILAQNKKDEKDLDMKGLEALVKLAIEQSKKESKNDNKNKTNDER